MSRSTKLGSASYRREGGPPAIYRVLLRSSISKLREPILIIFDVLESRQVVLAGLLFFMGFVTAWSFDPERFMKKQWFREIKFREIIVFS